MGGRGRGRGRAGKILNQYLKGKKERREKETKERKKNGGREGVRLFSSCLFGTKMMACILWGFHGYTHIGLEN